MSEWTVNFWADFGTKTSFGGFLVRFESSGLGACVAGQVSGWVRGWARFWGVEKLGREVTTVTFAALDPRGQETRLSKFLFRAAITGKNNVDRQIATKIYNT